MTVDENALRYHRLPRPGKISVTPTKPFETSHDLSLAYSPGVAAPCLEIERNPNDVYRYTSKGNLVAVISNGTAVLGLGDIGPAASKPVMEGKGVLFKAFADIDVFDLELDCESNDEFIRSVKALAPTFGGINLEDIKAPDCFYIEQQLKEALDIPVFHDDQHGTAIINAAGLLSALEFVEKDLSEVRVVVSGAGAAAVACVDLLFNLGMRRENLMMCDSTGVIYRGRTQRMNEFKERYAVDTTARSIADAVDGADVFIGLSVKDLMTPEMLLSMAERPIVFALANPDPEIDYPLAKQTRKDVVMATGRSDYPNQVNNVLGFPFIFRGALDVRAKSINEEMKLAAVLALRRLAKEPVSEGVRRAYGNISISFGAEYLIPKPLDPRVLYYVAPAVAQAAIESGVAREEFDIEEYTLRLKGRQNHGRVMLRGYYSVSRKTEQKRIAYSEGEHPKVIKAAMMARDEGLAEPILLGQEERIREEAQKLELDVSELQIIDPTNNPRFPELVEKFYQAQQRRGFPSSDAERLMRKAHYFGCQLLAEGDIEGLICGVDRYYPETIRPVLNIVGLRDGVSTAAGLYLVSIQDRLLFFSDVAINTEMSAEKLASIAMMTADFAESMDITPRVAMLSYSNFGSVRHPTSRMVRTATEMVLKQRPNLLVDGEMQADTALVEQILQEHYPFSRLQEPANILVFPDMQSGNIAYKLLQRLGGARVVGPIILGLKAPAYAVQRHASVDEIFNLTTVAVAQAALARG